MVTRRTHAFDPWRLRAKLPCFARPVKYCGVPAPRTMRAARTSRAFTIVTSKSSNTRRIVPAPAPSHPDLRSAQLNVH
jgi:hypothetical protein